MDKRQPDQRHLVAAIGYLFTPVVPIVILTGTTRRDPMLRKHAAQSLIWAFPFLILLIGFVVAAILLLRASPLTICLLPFLFFVPFLPGALWARKVYLAGDVNIPGLTPLAATLFPPTSDVS